MADASESPEQVQMSDTTALVLTLARCYDLLAVIARHLDEETAEEILDEHEQGLLRMPPPFLRVPVDD